MRKIIFAEAALLLGSGLPAMAQAPAEQPAFHNMTLMQGAFRQSWGTILRPRVETPSDLLKITPASAPKVEKRSVFSMKALPPHTMLDELMKAGIEAGSRLRLPVTTLQNNLAQNGMMPSRAPSRKLGNWRFSVHFSTGDRRHMSGPFMPNGMPRINIPTPIWARYNYAVLDN